MAESAAPRIPLREERGQIEQLLSGRDARRQIVLGTCCGTAWTLNGRVGWYPWRDHIACNSESEAPKVKVCGMRRTTQSEPPNNR
jgi:hypothetical protein